MTYQIGIRGLGLAILAVAAVGCASPYAYHGGNCFRPFAISGRHAECDGVPAEGCGAEPCGPNCGTVGPCRLRDTLACHSGCGRMYWGEWAYDPPDECDACNNHGDWVGPRCCPPSGWLHLWSGLRGSRFDNSCGSPTCTECSVPTSRGCGTEVFSDESPDDVWVDQSTQSWESEMRSSLPEESPPESVLRESRAPTPARHPASRLVRRTRTPEVKYSDR